MERGQKKTADQTTTNGKKFHIKRQFDPNYIGSKGETNTLPSMTQPDMSLTVQDLLRNHSRSSEASMRTPHYFDTEIPQFDDITEEVEYKQELLQTAKELDETIKTEKSEAKKKRLSDEKIKKAEDLAKAKKLLQIEDEPPQTED